MRIVILTHNNDRHYYFCNEIIEKTNLVVGVITGAKYRKLNFQRKLKIYKKDFLKLIRNKFLNLIFWNFNKKLFKEKKSQEKYFFKNQKLFFLNNYKNLILANIDQRHNSINDDFYVSLIRKQKPDIILVMGTCILGKKIINSAKHVINMHTGLSPYYRGGWTNLFPIIFNDYGYFGVTIHKMSTGIDSGDIIFTKRIKVNLSDTFSSINCNSIIQGTDLMIKTVELIRKNKINSIKQWSKGKLILGRNYNGLTAFKYFLKKNFFLKKHLDLQNSNLLPKISLVKNGELYDS